MVFWSDSTNVLWWIKGHSRVYKPFVANRISEIQSCTDPSQWRYVPTKLNPADYLTRGLSVPDLIERKSWWEGPYYLHDTEDNWPKNKLPSVSDEAKQEVKRAYFELNSLPDFIDKIGSLFDAADTTMVTIDKSNQTWSWRLDPECFSDWFRLTRVYSWVTRFVNNCRVNKEHRLSGPLKKLEIQKRH